MAVITISRELGSGGDEIARRVAELVGYRYCDPTLMAQVAQEQGISDAEIVDFSEERYQRHGFVDALLRRTQPAAYLAPGVTSPTSSWTTTTLGPGVQVGQTADEETVAGFVAETIRVLGRQGEIVIVGRGGQAILRDQADVLHVRIVARLQDRVDRVMEGEKLTKDAAQRHVEDRDRAAAQYLHRFHGIDWAEPALYHLTLNTSLLRQDEAAELVATAARRLAVRPETEQPAAAPS